MHPEHIPFAQKINDEESLANGFVRKKEVDDGSSTLAQVGDYTRKSCTVRRTIESMFQRRRSIKIENSSKDVVCLEKEPTCSSMLQKLEDSKYVPRLSKKEDNDDNISMIVHLDLPSSSSPFSSCNFAKSKNKVGSHPKKNKFDRVAFDSVSSLSVSNEILVVDSDTLHSSSPSQVPSKVLAKRRSLFESSKNQKLNYVLADSYASKTFDGLPVNFIQESTSTKSSGFVKKKEIDDNLSTMVIHDISPPASPKPIIKNTGIPIESHSKTVDFDSDVLESGSHLLGKSEVSRVSSGLAVSTTPRASKAMIKRPDLIEPNTIQKTINGFEQDEPADLDMTMPTDDNGANERSVWELDAESEDIHDDRGSGEVCSASGSDMDIDERTTAKTNDSSKKDKLACLDCPAVFKTKVAFNEHISSHEGYRKFKCDVCEKQFISRGNFNLHNRIHTGERPFECDVCEKSFKRSEHLIFHERIHTGERPFKCDVCEKRFVNRGNLNVHKRTHTGDKPFKCDICEKGFTQDGHLTEHIRIHSDERLFKCSFCEKSFKQKMGLRNHQVNHTGKKPFKCSDCRKCFSRKVDLRKHKLAHTGKKPYKCLTCGTCFRWASNLSRHNHTHTDLDTHNLPDVVQHSMNQSSTVGSDCLPNDSTDGQKIRYKSRSIEYIVEKMATRNPNIVYLVWSKKFTMDLASAVARSGYNCLLCVKKFQPASFPDVLNSSNTVQTSLIEIGPDAMQLRLFSFGGMVIPEKIGRHGRFKSLAKLESKLTKFSRSQGMELVNTFKHSENKNGWYESLRRDLKEDCIITDKS